MIEKLYCVRLGTPELRETADFATRIVGLQPVASPEGTALFRSDFRDHTLSLYTSPNPQQTLAVEVRSQEILDSAVARLKKAGYAVTIDSADTCAQKRVKACAFFRLRDGVTIDLVVRPLHSGWRYFASRDAGITEFFGVALASTDVEADIKLWTTIFNGRVTDYVGDAAYIGIDDEHHRIAIHPSTSDRLLEIQFRLEGLHEIMQNKYFMQSSQVSISHGPGRRAASQQVFLTFRGPGPVLFGFVAEGDKVTETDRVPRQFPAAAGSYCTWGSFSDIEEFKSIAL